MDPIEVIGGEAADDAMNILIALGDSCGLQIRRAQATENESSMESIVLRLQPKSQSTGDQPYIRVIPYGTFTEDNPVQFGNGPRLPFPFKGRTIQTGSILTKQCVDFTGEVMATAGGQAVWISA